LRPALRKASLVGLVVVLSFPAGYGLEITGPHGPPVLAVLLSTGSGTVSPPVLQALPGGK
jgi:hypothetical protein